MRKYLLSGATLAIAISAQQGAFALDACDRQELAEKIRDNSRIYLSPTHPSGVVDSANARQTIVDTANGQQAKRSAYGNAPGGTTWLDPRMLNAMDRLEQVYGYSYSVSETCGGSHSVGSLHYSGVAFDTYIINGVGVSASNPYWQTFLQRCRDMGATETLGPGDAGHDTHVHAAWTVNGGNVAPSGCVNNKDNVHVFGRGGDGACWLRSWHSSSGWGSWYSLGGNIEGGPDAYSRNANHVAVVVNSATEPGHIKQNVWSGSWGGWSDLWTSGGGNMTSDPSCCARGTDNVHIFARGPNGDCMKRSWNATTGWAAWASEGGSLAGAPDCCSKSASHLYVCVRSAIDVGHIKGKTWDATTGWGGWIDIWTSVGGNMDSDPSVVNRGTTKMHVFARKGSEVWIRTNTEGSGWAEWYSLGAPAGSSIVGAPDSYSRGSDHVAVVVRNQYNNCWKKTWTANTGWGQWEALDQPTGGLTSSPGAVAR